MAPPQPMYSLDYRALSTLHISFFRRTSSVGIIVYPRIYYLRSLVILGHRSIPLRSAQYSLGPVSRNMTLTAASQIGRSEDASWKAKADAKKQQQLKLIPENLRLKSFPSDQTLDFASLAPESFGLLSGRDIEITNITNVAELVEKLQKRAYSAVEVVGAFSNRAIVAHQLVNCLTEIFVDNAILRAKQLDEYYEKNGKPVGPLHGLPISLKEQIDIKDVEMTFGYVGWIGKISKEDSAIVKVLIDQGAIPYVRTNIPQSLMAGESNNAIFGRTINPHNRNLTCGGSSGGEGALIAMKGSILGVGSDIGGSVRIPSAFQGLYGLRPSYNRVPYNGSTNSMEGQEAIYSVLGPITASIEGLKMFMKNVADSRPWKYDPIALRLPWNEESYKLSEHGGEGAQLCFAIQWSDGVCNPSPPYIRALNETKKALEAAGHSVIDWVSYKPDEGENLLQEVLRADGGEDMKRQLNLSGEPNTCWFALESHPHLSTYEYWQLCRRKLTFLKGQLEHWEGTVSKTTTGRPVDAIISPVASVPPPPHGGRWWIYYTGMCNLADYTTGVFPVTKVDPEVDRKPKRSNFINEEDRKSYELYDPEVMKNGPISLQCIGRKNEEEAVIRMTEIIDDALKRSKCTA